MKHWLSFGCLAVLLAGICEIWPVNLSAQGVKRADLIRKQEDQERARGMTRQLLDGVLNLQMQQLEENGLTDLPVYRDIRLMREHLQEIVDQEMVKVVELLAKAQAGTPKDRDATFIEARQMVRSVVVRLSAERQSLLRRLKAAELAEQAQRLIALQTDVEAATRTLPEEAEQRREATLLKTQEDQRDVKELFLHLVDTLDDIRTWGGPIADTAVDGLRILKADDVGEHVDQAEKELLANHLPDALDHQTGVIKGLNDFLKLLQRQQGLLQAERNVALEKLQAIADQQSELKSQAEQLPPDTPASTELVEQQVQIEQQIQALSEQLPETVAGELLAEKAEQAAASAAEELLEADNSAAIEKQTETLANLSALEEILKRGERAAISDRSAAELAHDVAQLQAAKSQLEPAVKQQQDLPEVTDASAPDAAKVEAELAAKVEEITKSSELPETVEAALLDAQGELKSAAEALANATTDDDMADRAAVDDSSDALEDALSTIAAELAVAERLAAAVKIGELARAAEVLERAAAEERDIARSLSEGMSQPEQLANVAEKLASRQDEVAAIAEKVAAGLETIAPEAGAKVNQASENAQQVGEQLDQAAKSPSNPQGPADQARSMAEATANQLADAAGALREQIQAAAKSLAAQSAQQAAALAQAREAVEAVKSPTAQSLSQRMQQLSAAQQKTQQAAAEQQRASGRPEAAAAMDLAQQIAATQSSQLAAGELAEQWSRGESATPLKAAAAQQAVAELAANLADEAQKRGTDSVVQDDLQATARALNQAQAAAQQASRQLLNNQPAAADAAQQQAQASLQEALAQAQAAAKKLQSAQPTAEPSMAAQSAAQQAAEMAAELAQTDAAEAAQSLTAAALAGEDAQAALAQKKSSQVETSQAAAQEAIDAAQQQLSAAMQNLARQQAAALAQQARQTGPLANPTAMLDPAAGRALDSAEQAAAMGSDPAQSAEMQATAAASAERQLERAIASLAAREQEVRRDQAVAEALAALATQQQQAADTLAQQRQAAMQAANASENAPQVNAAQAAEAARNFAEAQMATGQGAVELSGQQQVANAPLRDALELAQSLLTTQIPMTPAEFLAEAAAMAQGEAPPNSESLPAEAGTGSPMDSGNEDAVGDLNQAQGQATSPAGSTPRDTGFVPQSPEKTAQMMAGPQLAQAMQQQAAADAATQMQPGTPNSQNAQTSPAGQPLETNSQAQTASQDPATQAGSALQTARRQSGQTDNTGVKDGPLQDQPEGTDLGDSQGNKRTGDAEVSARQFQEQPWFAKLPPELRKAIRAGAQQKAPKAYEDKLRRYFQSVD